MTPIVIASEVIQFVTVMAAKTFQEFLIYYLIRLMVQYSNRIYINPFIQNIYLKLKKLKVLALRHNRPRLAAFLSKVVSISNVGQKLEFYKEEKEAVDEQDD